MWIDELREKVKKADKFPLTKSYEEIKAGIEERAEHGADFTFFDYIHISDEIREKLRSED